MRPFLDNRKKKERCCYRLYMTREHSNDPDRRNNILKIYKLHEASINTFSGGSIQQSPHSCGSPLETTMPYKQAGSADLRLIKRGVNMK